MVSKCANPGCSARFLYLHEGKVFRFERPPRVDKGFLLGFDRTMRKHSPGVEFYWLCPKCASTMKLVYYDGIGVTTYPRYPLLKAAS